MFKRVIVPLAVVAGMLLGNESALAAGIKVAELEKMKPYVAYNVEKSGNIYFLKVVVSDDVWYALTPGKKKNFATACWAATCQRVGGAPDKVSLKMLDEGGNTVAKSSWLGGSVISVY